MKPKQKEHIMVSHENPGISYTCDLMIPKSQG